MLSSSNISCDVARFSSIFFAMPVRQVFSAPNCHGRSRSAAVSCPVTAFASPTSATSAGTFVPISSAAMSICTTRTSGLKRGGRPKCMIQFSRAPIRNTRSAFCRTCERAGATESGWSSGSTPFPIGEARNGSCVDSMNSRTSSSARAYAAPLPTMTSGRSALRNDPSAASTAAGSASDRGGSGTRAGMRTASSSARPPMMSAGRSRYTGPGRP